MKWEFLKERILDEYASRNLKTRRRIKALDKVEQFIYRNHPNLRNNVEELLAISIKDIKNSYTNSMHTKLNGAENSVINEIYNQLKTPSISKEKINLKLYQIRAIKALPYLMCYAKAKKAISYSKLAELVGMPNPRNLGVVLAEIGYILSKVDRDIPTIQSIVVSKTTKLPSTGLSEFIKGYDKRTKKEKRIIFEIESQKVFKYNKWDAILRDLGLEPITFNIEDDVRKIRSGKYGKGGEGELHKTMKEIISKHPDVIGLSESAILISKEYTLWSADCVDIMFEDKKGEIQTAIAVEVKASNSDSADIFRGLFQCIKYKSIMQAMNKIENTYSDFRVILVLENDLPVEYDEIRDILEIEVIDNLNLNKEYKEYLKKYK